MRGRWGEVNREYRSAYCAWVAARQRGAREASLSLISDLQRRLEERLRTGGAAVLVEQDEDSSRRVA